MTLAHVLPFLLLASLVSLGSAPPGWTPPAQTGACTVRIAPAEARPGDVVVALGSCETPPADLRGRFGGVPVTFFPLEDASPSAPAAADPEAAEAGASLLGDSPPTSAAPAPPVERQPAREFAALIGIDVTASPGRMELAWEARLEGSDASGTVPLAVEPRAFAVQHLRLPRRFVQPDSAAQERIRLERERLGAILASRTPERLWSGPFTSPVPGAEGDGFGARRVLNGVRADPHTGMDLRASAGEAVQAPNEGRVVLVDTLYYAGKTLVLDHGLGLFTIYSHLSATSVQPGDAVRAGQLLGRVGATGRVTGPHLHWAVQLNRARVDPTSLMAATSGADLRPRARLNVPRRSPRRHPRRTSRRSAPRQP